MMNRCWLLLLLLSTSEVNAQALRDYVTISFDQQRAFAGQNFTIHKVIPDHAGNAYVIYMAGIRNDINNTFYNFFDYQAYYSPYMIARFDSAGNFLWGMATRCDLVDAVVDSKNNLITTACNVAGNYFDNVTVYLPHNEVKADTARSMLLKIAPEGKLLWSQKKGLDYSRPRARVWVDADDRVYWLVNKNGSWVFNYSYECYDAEGALVWNTSIDNIVLDAEEMNSAGETWFCGYHHPEKSGQEIDWKCCLFMIDVTGKIKQISETSGAKAFNTGGGNYMRGQHYVNYIGFDESNNPVLAYVDLFGSGFEQVNVAGKKFKEKDGEFLFVQFNEKGDYVTSYQEKINTEVNSDHPSFQIGYCHVDRKMGVHYQNAKWYFCIPVNTSWSHFDGYTALLSKNDMELREMTITPDKASIDWKMNALLNYRYNPQFITISKCNDTTIFLSGVSTEPGKVKNVPYNIVYRVALKSTAPVVHLWATMESSSIKTEGPYLRVTVSAEQKAAIPLNLNIKMLGGGSILDTSFTTGTNGEARFIFNTKTWQTGAYTIHVYDMQHKDLVAILVERE